MFRNTRNSMICAAVAAAAGLSVSALAQQSSPPAPPPPPDLQGDFAQPIEGGRGGSRSTMVLKSIDNGRESTVRFENGEVTRVEVDGKQVGAERVKREGDKVRIVDEKGATIAEFTVMVEDGRAMIFQRQQELAEMERRMATEFSRGRALRAENLARAEELRARGIAPVVAEPPPVMVGVTMSDAAQDGGIVIDSLVDGLPAAKAGIKAGDVITAISGKPAQNSEALREILRNSKPGDKLPVTVQRGKDKLDLTIELEAYDSTKLSTISPRAWVELSPEGFYGQRGLTIEGEPLLELSLSAQGEARKALELALKEIEGLKVGADLDKLRADLDKHLNEALSAIEDKASRARELALRRFGTAQQGRAPIVTEEGGNIFVVPPAPVSPRSPSTITLSPQNDQVNKKLDALLEKLDDMNKRLEKLESGNKP